MIYITAATTTTVAGAANGIRVQVNTPLASGTITVQDGGVTKAIITNPGATAFIYYGFTGAVSLITSATCDITVSILTTTH